MKTLFIRTLLLFILIGGMISACASAHTAAQNPADVLSEFPLAKGTTWVYSYVEYRPTTANPAQITTATYEFTEKVVDTKWQQAFFIAYVQHQEHLVKADADWVPTGSSRPAETWYVVRGNQVYENRGPLDLTNIQTDALLLAYDFPLVTGKSWCPSNTVKGVKIQDCTASGKRSVARHASYETPAGKFTNCHQITEDFNSGGITRWLCDGVGVVAEKYDHAGTRFGFEQVLASFSKGTQ